jgi:hypothetical protein
MFKQEGLEDLPAAIREFEEALPGWWLRLGFCFVSNDTTCAPQGKEYGCPDYDLIELGTPFDHGFMLDYQQPSTLAETLRDLTALAVKARDEKRKELMDV